MFNYASKYRCSCKGGGIKSAQLYLYKNDAVFRDRNAPLLVVWIEIVVAVSALQA